MKALVLASVLMLAMTLAAQQPGARISAAGVAAHGNSEPANAA
jgi:hypothetical protein